LRNVVKKVITFSAPPPIKKVHQEVAMKGGSSPPHRQEIFGHVIGQKLPQVNLKVTCNQRSEKTFTLSQLSTFVPSFISIEAFFIIS
jgi:hypothetical protein